MSCYIATKGCYIHHDTITCFTLSIQLLPRQSPYSPQTVSRLSIWLHIAFTPKQRLSHRLHIDDKQRLHIGFTSMLNLPIQHFVVSSQQTYLLLTQCGSPSGCGSPLNCQPSDSVNILRMAIHLILIRNILNGLLMLPGLLMLFVEEVV